MEKTTRVKKSPSYVRVGDLSEFNELKSLKSYRKTIQDNKKIIWQTTSLKDSN